MNLIATWLLLLGSGMGVGDDQPAPLTDVPDEPKPFEYYAQQMQQQQS